MGHDDPHHPNHHHSDPVRAQSAPEEHKSHAPAQVACFVLTCSDSRHADEDASGKLICEQLLAANHTLAGRRLIPDDAEEIRKAIEEAVSCGARAMIITGGTGIARRDSTYEVVSSILEKRLDGFGELFRMLSFQEIGSAAMMSRAVAGTYRGLVVFALPGSTGAVRLAMTRLILPELGHAVRELTR
jgi:molybdenum cofactor biosynthesis protein B